jgi:hypothetical protein
LSADQGVSMDVIAYNVVLLAELHRVLETLRAQGVPVIVLKGPVLGQMLYSHPAKRQMGDLDLLVRREDRQIIGDTLHKLAYEFSTHYSSGHTLAFAQQFGAEATAWRRVGSASVYLDLHENLISLEWLRLASAIDLEQLWVDSRPFYLDGTELARQLSPEHLLIHLCVHWAAHGFTGQRYGEELLRVSQALSFDRDRLVQQAVTFRVAGMVYWAFFLAGQVAGEGVGAAPEILPTIAVLRPPNWRCYLLMRLTGPESVKRFDKGIDDFRTLIHLALVDRHQDVLRVVLFALLPSLGWIRERYCLTSQRQALLYYPRHWRRLVRCGRQAIAQMILRSN